MDIRPQTIWFEQALLPDGWAVAVRVGIIDGRIATIERNVAPQGHDARFVTALPGLANVHSHAFQRSIGGMAEVRGGPEHDDFWGWREVMYRLVGVLTPDDVAVITAMAFVEMLEAGFTRVGEFHYLHHQPSGEPYDDPAAMAAAVASAAEETGIALTLLPVFYAHGGFGGKAPEAGQRRFVNDMDGFANLLEASRHAVGGLADGTVGVAPHSLRAVTPEQLAALAAMAPDAPIHIHIAEQQKEVADCIEWSGQRPVAWLMDHAAVDARWCLVHATHIDPEELTAIAARGAVVGLCPITEANLGDGMFPAEAFLAAGGMFGIGSDSNIRIDAGQELQLLEYGQRLSLRRRNVLSTTGASTGRTLFDGATAGGGRAVGHPAGIALGHAADLIALSGCACGDRTLDRWIFAGGGPVIDAVWRRGVQVVSNGRHGGRDEIAARFTKVAARLLQ
jgi:formiminoglutamate deiminase